MDLIRFVLNDWNIDPLTFLKDSRIRTIEDGNNMDFNLINKTANGINAASWTSGRHNMVTFNAGFKNTREDGAGHTE